MGKLDGLATVITGAGSGIGRASALEFAREGACVLAADLNADSAAETARQIGANAASVGVDVTSVEQVEHMLQTAVDRFGKLDVLFNNAGVPQSFTPLEESTDALFDRIFEVNVRGVFNGCRAAIPHLKARGGVILNTASTAGIRPRPGLAVYNASKAAVISLTKTLALELAPLRIRVVSICPVATDTPMLPGFMGEIDPTEGRQRFISTIPWGRLNRPEDLARAAVFLASSDAEMVTGTAFEVDGGRDV